MVLARSGDAVKYSRLRRARFVRKTTERQSRDVSFSSSSSLLNPQSENRFSIAYAPLCRAHDPSSLSKRAAGIHAVGIYPPHSTFWKNVNPLLATISDTFSLTKGVSIGVRHALENETIVDRVWVPRRCAGPRGSAIKLIANRCASADHHRGNRSRDEPTHQSRGPRTAVLANQSGRMFHQWPSSHHQRYGAPLGFRPINSYQCRAGRRGVFQVVGSA